jgi:transcriptional regulator with XRE-family HTH domain
MAVLESPQGFGEQLRWWRTYRRLSQLDLAGLAGVSAKHLSYLETGRSSPSPEMVLHLARHLDIPIREQNALLLAAGYAPRYPERTLDDDAMADVRHVVDLQLRHHQPYPAVCVDRRWDLLAANDAAWAFVDGVAAELLEPPMNVMRLSLHPGGLAPRIRDFATYAAHLLAQLRAEATRTADRRLAELIAEIAAYPTMTGIAGTLEPHDHTSPILPLRIQVGDQELSFITTIATIGAPREVTTSELAIEAFYPADAATTAAYEAR